MSIENETASPYEVNKNQYIEKITQMFGKDFNFEKDPKPEDLFDLSFSTVLSKDVRLSGRLR